MRVTIIYNDQIRVIEEKVKSKFKYIAKSVEIIDDDLTVKYTHVYTDHISSKYYKLSPEFKKYKSMFEK